MHDMFYNYDNDIDTNFFRCKKITFPEKLESESTISLVKDVFENEVGVKVKQGSEFSLYFYLTGEVDGSSIQELVENSIITFKERRK